MTEITPTQSNKPKMVWVDGGYCMPGYYKPVEEVTPTQADRDARNGEGVLFMIKYSAEWIKEQAGDANWLDHHACGGCFEMVGYQLSPDYVVFNSNCGCSRYASQSHPSSWQDISEWLAMQSSDEIRDKIMQGFQPKESGHD